MLNHLDSQDVTKLLKVFYRQDIHVLKAGFFSFLLLLESPKKLVSGIFYLTLGKIACLLKPLANARSWILDVGLWLKTVLKTKGFWFLGKSYSFQVKYKPWAHHSWVSASFIHYGASRGLVYTQKDQLAIKNKQIKLPKPRVHISYPEYEKCCT